VVKKRRNGSSLFNDSLTTIKGDANELSCLAYHFGKNKGAVIHSFSHFRFCISFSNKDGQNSWLMTPAPSFPGQSMRS
jgi:hypothetical protein